MANSLLDVIKDMFSGNQTNFNVLSNQFETMARQLDQKRQLPPPPKQATQSQQANQTSKSSNVIYQPFPVYEKETMRIAVNPFTGKVEHAPVRFPSESHPVDYPHYKNAEISSSTTKVQSTKPKKALTSETIPVLPYTSKGFIGAVSEAYKQGKISPAQAQQLLQVIAPQELSAENIYTTLENEIKALPGKFKTEKETIKSERDKAYNEVKDNLDKQVKIAEKYADQEIKWLENHLKTIEKMFTELMKEKPNLEPDKWTLFGRQLAMALGAISALAHPEYAPYFYMAIPQVVQYWQNQDMYNFEKAMRKFEAALKLAGTQLDFYNQIMEFNLKILEKKKDKELLPLTLTGQLLTEKYRSLVELYNKMESESYKVNSDEIANLLKVADLKGKVEHNQRMEALQKERNEIMKRRAELDALMKKSSLAIKNALLKITKEKFELQKDMLLHPEKYPGKILPSIMGKAGSVKESAQILQPLYQSKDLKEWIDSLIILGEEE